MTILLLIAVLLVTVLVHEWGHFITAKKSGMRVEEFGFGIPPRLWSWKRGETTYSINALPFGGFVKIAGENGLEEGVATEKQFESKPWYTQSLVLVAGVLCNILLAIALFTFSYSIGTPAIDPSGKSTVLDITKGGPIDLAGIKVGDTIVSITKGEKQITPITTHSIREVIHGETKPLSITYIHQKEMRTAVVTPRVHEGNTIIGVAIEPIVLSKTSFSNAFLQAIQKTTQTTQEIFQTVGGILARLITGEKQQEQLIGPVGLAGAIRSASNMGFSYLLGFTAMISINLAVLNILPFPALDGGRLLIVLLERIFRKKFSKRVVGVIHAIGFLILITLMVALSVGDIRRLF